ncbi:MAG: hypothetical protein WKF37_17385 [Bryobacteraceae bacterium]
MNNTFVEWASIQAIRRAKPSMLVAAFGIRNKVKPFSGMLIFTDQDEATAIPTQADMLGSYVDLEIFYQYILQEAGKHAGIAITPHTFRGRGYRRDAPDRSSRFSAYSAAG